MHLKNTLIREKELLYDVCEEVGFKLIRKRRRQSSKLAMMKALLCYPDEPFTAEDLAYRARDFIQKASQITCAQSAIFLSLLLKWGYLELREGRLADSPTIYAKTDSLREIRKNNWRIGHEN